MKIEEKLLNKLEQLLSEGDKILDSCGWDGKDYRNWPSKIDYVRFRTEGLNIIKRACGESSDHYQSLRKIADDAKNEFYFTECVAIVGAARNDYRDGYIFDIKSLVAAEVLSNFIEQSEVLLQYNYFIPAASLIGAILEDILRKLSEANGIEIPEKTKIDRLNADLAKAGAYDKLVQKRITALADIRNNADHGHFDKFTKEDVEDMMSFVKRFTADYLA